MPITIRIKDVKEVRPEEGKSFRLKKQPQQKAGKKKGKLKARKMSVRLSKATEKEFGKMSADTGRVRLLWAPQLVCMIRVFS